MLIEHSKSNLKQRRHRIWILNCDWIFVDLNGILISISTAFLTLVPLGKANVVSWCCVIMCIIYYLSLNLWTFNTSFHATLMFGRLDAVVLATWFPPPVLRSDWPSGEETFSSRFTTSHNPSKHKHASHGELSYAWQNTRVKSIR